MDSEKTRTTKVVINRSPTKFMLSDQAVEIVRLLRENTRAFVEITVEREQRPITIDTICIRRDDPDLIATIEKLGIDANGRDVELEIVSIPECGDWYIGDVCGIEYVVADGVVWPRKS